MLQITTDLNHLTINSNHSSLDNIPTLTQSPKNEQLLDMYGEKFCNAIGIENLLKMPQLPLESLLFTSYNDFYTRAFTVEKFVHAADQAHAVRGVDTNNHPYIAIKLAYLDKNKDKKYEFIEVIYQKNKYEMDNYKACSFNICSDDKSRLSKFSKKLDLNLIKNLFENKTLKLSQINEQKPLKGFLKLSTSIDTKVNLNAEEKKYINHEFSSQEIKSLS